MGGKTGYGFRPFARRCAAVAGVARRKEIARCYPIARSVHLIFPARCVVAHFSLRVEI